LELTLVVGDLLLLLLHHLHVELLEQVLNLRIDHEVVILLAAWLHHVLEPVSSELPFASHH